MFKRIAIQVKVIVEHSRCEPFFCVPAFRVVKGSTQALCPADLTPDNLGDYAGLNGLRRASHLLKLFYSEPRLHCARIAC